MITIDVLDKLCKRYTNLNEIDIKKLKDIKSNLQYFADLNQANVFIDCLTHEINRVIVVAEATPYGGSSLYKYPVVGEFAYESFEPAVFHALQMGERKLLHRAVTQEGKIVEQNVIPIFGKGDSVIAALIMEKDISERVQEEGKIEALSEATEKLSEIMFNSFHTEPIVPEVIEEALFYIDANHKIKYYNTSAENLAHSFQKGNCQIGYLVTDLLPFLKDILHLPEALSVREIHEDNRFFKLKKIALNQHEPNEGTLIFIRDLTELKEKERELVLKSVAIQEIHHRVKNNLQTIASLIRLQMRRGIPDNSKKYFEETLSRILSIASVYEITLAENSTDIVNVDLLIQKISSMILHTEEHRERSIRYSYKGINFQATSNKAITIALIVNELILNCIKHAFKKSEDNLIQITFQKINSLFQLTVSDNGTGYNPNPNSSFGLDIVKMMAEYNLNGEFTIKRKDRGTVATVIFPLEGSEIDAK